MPKLSPEERAELERQLADDDDDDDFEFHYGEGDRTISLPWSRRHELGDFGFKGAPKRPASGGAGAGTGRAGSGGGAGAAGGEGKNSGGPSPLFGQRQRRSGTGG